MELFGTIRMRENFSTCYDEDKFEKIIAASFDSWYGAIEKALLITQSLRRTLQSWATARAKFSKRMRERQSRIKLNIMQGLFANTKIQIHWNSPTTTHSLIMCNPFACSRVFHSAKFTLLSDSILCWCSSIVHIANGKWNKREKRVRNTTEPVFIEWWQKTKNKKQQQHRRE